MRSPLLLTMRQMVCPTQHGLAFRIFAGWCFGAVLILPYQCVEPALLALAMPPRMLRGLASIAQGPSRAYVRSFADSSRTSHRSAALVLDDANQAAAHPAAF